ncbi:Egl nine 1 [Trebouxia sp. C0010 RCD-2024]
MSTTSDFGDEETEEEVVELSEIDLLQLLDSQEPALQVCSRIFTQNCQVTSDQLKLLSQSQLSDLKSIGFIIKDACMTVEAAQQLHAEVLRLHSLGSLQQASQVGMMPDMRMDKFTDVSARDDQIMWLHEGEAQSPETSARVQAMQVLQDLQTDLHAVMRLEKRSAEYQLAVYMGAGSQYVKHRDALPDDAADSNQRRVTAILYANPDWAPGHGGELRLWLPPGASDRRYMDAASMDDCAAPNEHEDGSASVPPLDHAGQASSRSASTPGSHDLGCHSCGDKTSSAKQLDEISNLRSLKLQDGQTSGLADVTHHLTRTQKGVHQRQVNGELVVDVAPVSGRLVVFLSGAVDHAVLPSHQPRVALTAWCQ